MNLAFMEKFTTSIRKKYQRNLINKEKQWPPRHTEKLIRLVLVENDGGNWKSRSKRTPIEYEDLFKVNKKRKAEQATKILVEGDAGIGKTTLCTAIAEDWASMKLFQQFKLLLLLPLRETLVSTASSLTKLLHLLHSSKSTCKSIANILEEDEGEDVLIVADGWDELAKSKRQEDTFLYNLLFGKILPFASVLLTSRHTASVSLHRDPNFCYFVEICGFSHDNIKEYIFSEFDDNKDIAVRLLEQLESNPLVESICNIPLNCAIICHLWRTLKENDLPTTMTNLYTKIILNVILRNIQKFPAYKNTLSLPNLCALPATLQQSWWLLCDFAYQTLARDQLVFTEEELANFFPQGLSLDENILCFGMLQSTESILDIGCGLTFHFPHRTFQEFLAALYIVKLPIDAQVNGHITFTNSPLYFRFFFGLSFHIGNSIIKQTDDKRTDLLLAAKGIIECLCILIYQHYQHEYLPLLHCSFEADNSYIYNKVVNCIIVPKKRSVLRSDSYMSLDIPTAKYTAYDCTALIHLFANTSKCGTLEISMIDFNKCGIRDKQVVALGDALASKHGKLQVNILSLSKNKLTWESLRYLFNRASAAFQSLEELWLSNIDTKVDSSVLSDTLSVIDCPNLRSLDLSNNVLGVAGARAVGRLVSNLTQHERNFELYLNETQLGDEGLKVFTCTLAGKCHIRCLELQKNDIHIDGVTCIAEVICSGKLILGEVEFEHPLFTIGEMWGLDLTGNPLGIEGLLAIGRILNCSGYFFGSLYLVDCKLTHTVNVHSSLQCIQQFCQMVPKLLVASHITKLYLDNNRFTGELSDILTRFIFLCPWLILLRTCSCDITSDDLRCILVRLSSLNYAGVICCWHLQNNKIDDEGVTILLQHLHSLFPKAEAITVGVTRHDSADDAIPSLISDDMLKKLREELAKLKEVLQ